MDPAIISITSFYLEDLDISWHLEVDGLPFSLPSGHLPVTATPIESPIDIQPVFRGISIVGYEFDRVR